MSDTGRGSATGKPGAAHCSGEVCSLALPRGNPLGASPVVHIHRRRGSWWRGPGKSVVTGESPWPQDGATQLACGEPHKVTLVLGETKVHEGGHLQHLGHPPPLCHSTYLGPGEWGLAATQLLKGRAAGLSPPAARGSYHSCSCRSCLLLLPQGVALDLLPNQQLPESLALCGGQTSGVSPFYSNHRAGIGTAEGWGCGRFTPRCPPTCRCFSSSVWLRLDMLGSWVPGSSGAAKELPIPAPGSSRLSTGEVMPARCEAPWDR